jgi:dUTPase
MIIPFGVIARLIRVERVEPGIYTRKDSHYFLMPKLSIRTKGIAMVNSIAVIDKSYRDELNVNVMTLTGHSVINIGEKLFQIVAPDLGWIRHVRIVDSIPNTLKQ